MPLLHDGKLIEDDKWSVFSDDAELPDNPAQAIVSMQRYIELRASGALVPGDALVPDGANTSGVEPVPVGVVVAPEDDVLVLAPYVVQLNLIAISFPVYTDGRGYSHARLLRKRMAYSGELRAIGDIRADQVLFMARSGIDSFDFSAQPDMDLVQTLVTRFEKNYQPSYALPVDFR